MPIPDIIKRDHVLKAIAKIDRDGVPKPRESYKYFLRYNGRDYPPKYVISLAYKYATGNGELDPAKFYPHEAKAVLERLGFEVYVE
jgi:hypothetical protein